MAERERMVHKPKKGTTFELPLGQQAEFDSPDHSITYCGMPSPGVYSLGIRGKSIETIWAQGSSIPGYNLFVPIHTHGKRQTLDLILEGTAEVEVLKVEPMGIVLKYVK